jgi:hypothetical protein
MKPCLENPEMKPGVQPAALAVAEHPTHSAAAQTIALKRKRAGLSGESSKPEPVLTRQSSASLGHPAAGSKSRGQPPRVSSQTLVWKRVQAAAKAVLGLGLALLTMDLIAVRMYNLPSAPNPMFGDVHEPGRRFRQQIEGNGSGVWTTNCVRRSSLPAASQEPVLLILGDSYTEAIQVRDEDHFAHLLEQRLGGIPVLAMGRSGYSVADYVAGAPTFRKLFGPDRVIIQVSAGDFEADAWTRKEGGYAYFERQQHSAPIGTLAIPQGTGALPVPPDPLKIVSLPVSPPGWLSSVTREKCPFLFPLVTFAYLRKSELKEWMEGNNQPWFHAATRKPASAAGQQGENSGQYPLDDEMKLLAEAYEGRLSLLYLPRFDPSNPAKETETEKTLHGLAEKYGVLFVSLREKFPELAAAGHAPYGFSNTRFNWGHWNRYGHQAAAELLFDKCKRLGVHQ